MDGAAVFLDRDGVICINRNLADIGQPDKEILSEEDVEIYPHVEDALALLSKNRFQLIVVTNQSKVGRGLITLGKLDSINNFIKELVERSGAKIEKFYNCPHKTEDNCNCRKPKIGLLEKAVKDYGIDLTKSWFVGDKTVDIQTGRTAGCKTILVKTGYGGQDKLFDVEPDFVADNLMGATQIILRKG